MIQYNSPETFFQKIKCPDISIPNHSITMSRHTATHVDCPDTSCGGGDPSADTMDGTLPCLGIVTPIVATFSLVVVMLAMFTNQWLHTEEKMNNPSYNGTGDKDYLSKRTISGLWMFCYTNVGETTYECNKIDYFTKEEYSPDLNDSTLAIPYAVTKSVFFFIAASCLLGTAYFCCILGYCAKHRGFYTFISGVSFIVTGLVMLFGLIMYISIFKAEVGGKLRPRSQLVPAAFTYHYGYSFSLYVTGFISTQLAATSAIFLFIAQVQDDYLNHHSSSSSTSAAASHNNPNHSRHKLSSPSHHPTGHSSHHPSTLSASMQNHLDQQQQQQQQQQYHQYHPAVAAHQLHLDQSRLYQRPCRRHPQAYINTNSVYVPDVPLIGYGAEDYDVARGGHVQEDSGSGSRLNQRRYFFSKEPLQDSSPCSVHRTMPATSGAPTSSGGLLKTTIPQHHQQEGRYYDFPPPPTISYQFDELGSFSHTSTLLSRHSNHPHPLQQSASPHQPTLPLLLPHSNTMSTTVDDSTTCVDLTPTPSSSCTGDDMDLPPPPPPCNVNTNGPPTSVVDAMVTSEFVTFDMDPVLPSALRAAVAANKLANSGGDTLRRTTPV